MKLKTKFQDADLRLGEVVDASIMYGCGDKIRVSCPEKMKDHTYNSIKDFTDHWEDALEEPKEYWYIDCYGTVLRSLANGNEWDERRKAIGNHFETEEEAEKAAKKLKAFTRLKDKGFRFIGKTYETGKRFGSIFYKVDDDTYSEDIIDDLDLLFGDEE